LSHPFLTIVGLTQYSL